jgi:tellurite resistance protein
MKVFVDRNGQERALRMTEAMIASHFNVSKNHKAVLEITEDSLTRSQRQNKLYWMWMTLIADEIGHTKEEMSEILQQAILGETSFVSKLDGENITRQTRAKQLTTAEFANFLEQIEYWAGEYGMRLPKPEDLYLRSMGVGSD